MSSPSTDSNITPKSRSSETNWYAKLHPIGTAQNLDIPKRPLNLSIFFRIWLAVALVLIICGVIIFAQLFSYVKPTVKQVIEDTLFDTSKLLAVSLQEPLETGELYNQAYQAQLDRAFNDSLKDEYPTGLPYDIKTHSSFRVYVTDASGMVIYDSEPAPNNAEGQDYSRWNDIYLTLRGQYGARSTISNNSSRDSSIMYVAQPIKGISGDIIGVVSVGKPVASVLPYLDNTRRRMLITALLVSVVALVLAGLVAWWLKQSISLVTRYTGALAEDTQKPYFYLGHELNHLTDTIETMKHRLENKAYVSDYVHTLTHELKSPLTAIRASGELLEDEGLDGDDRRMLVESVSEQSIKMQQLIDRLLLLAKVEQPTFKLNRQLTPLLPLLQSLIKDNSVKLQQANLPSIAISLDGSPLDSSVSNTLSAQTTVYADRFWLVQSLQNLLDNAIHFADTMITIDVHTAHSNASALTPYSVTVDIINDGKQLPDYALAKVFERYFSLSHQSISKQSLNTPPTPSSSNQSSPVSYTLRKGTGLGLTLVKQVIEHHGGHVSFTNLDADDQYPAGVKVSLTLPLARY